jgi:hypothetical protein
MPTASTVASIIVALAVIAAVVRWPRLPADRRVLERRAHGLEALATVVARSAASRSADHPGARPPDATPPPAPPDRTSDRHPAITAPATQGTAPPEVTAGTDRRATAGTDAVTVLGPVDTPRPRPDRPASLRARRSERRHHNPPDPSAPTGAAQTTKPVEVLRLGATDVPPDDDLSETTDSLHSWHAEASARPPATPSRSLHPALRPARATASSGSGVSAATADPPASATPSVSAPASLGAPRATGKHRRARVIAAATVALVVGGAVVVGVRSGPGPADATAVVAAALTPTPTPDPAPPPALTPVAASGDVIAFSAAAPFTLDLAAGAPSWVRVQTASGAVLFEGTLVAGEQTSVRAEEPVRIRLGNPAGVLAAADGGLLDHPRPPGQPLTLALG